jgi:hypothetical protein
VAAVSAKAAGYLGQIAFSTPRDGVGLFVHTVGHCGFDTRSTADGGLRFGAPKPLVASWSCESAQELDYRLVVDGLGDVFIYGRSLFASHDDGASWSQVRLPGSIEDIAAAGPSVWALSSGACKPTALFPTCRDTLYVSSDGGRSWSPAAHQPPVRTTEDFPTSNTLAHPTASRVDLVVAPPNARSVVTLEVSSDSGASWQVRDVPLQSPWVLALSVAFDGTIWVADAYEPGAGNQEKLGERSLDGGRHWTVVQLPVSGYFGDLSALSASTAFYTGGRSPLVGTFDGGKSWTGEADFSGQASGSSDVSFVNPEDGWAIDLGFGLQTVLWRTTDGGRHWVRAWLSPSPVGR